MSKQKEYPRTAIDLISGIEFRVKKPGARPEFLQPLHADKTQDKNWYTSTRFDTEAHLFGGNNDIRET
jgi:hypothetical protein